MLLFFCFTLIISSCQQKEYTCACGGGFSGTGVTITIKSASKSSAKRQCYNHNTPVGTPDGLSGCEIK